uniref:Guanylate cyclase domain-containing protein n=1 Tax=Macrostomum lignano TaxID=282301 RepID=A0A1I8FLP4_9PLAT
QFERELLGAKSTFPLAPASHVVNGPDPAGGFLAVYADLADAEQHHRMGVSGSGAPGQPGSNWCASCSCTTTSYRGSTALSLTALSPASPRPPSPPRASVRRTPSTSSSFSRRPTVRRMSNSVVFRRCCRRILSSSEATLEQDFRRLHVSVAIDSVAVLISWPVFNEFGSYTNSFANGNQLESDGEPDDRRSGASYMMTSWMAADSRDLPRHSARLSTDWDVADDDCHRGGVSQLVTRQVQLRQVSRSSGLPAEDQQQPSGDPAGTDSFAATAAQDCASPLITSSSTPGDAVGWQRVPADIRRHGEAGRAQGAPAYSGVGP